jgi:hypothetical protein
MQYIKEGCVIYCMGIILTDEQVSHYYQNGYLLIPGVFPLDKLHAAREVFIAAFESKLWENAPYSAPDIINDIFYFFPYLTNSLFPSVFFDIIKDLIGNDVIWIPECSIHRNRYIHWHKDTSIQEREGETSHHNFNAPLIQAAIYFQDNNEDGGGLTVLPGTNSSIDKYAKMMGNNLALRAYYKLLKSLGVSAMDQSEASDKKVDIASHKGDLLLFDLRIDHKSTPPNKNATLVTDKLAVFNTFGKDNDVTRNYFQFMKNRKEPYYRYFNEYPLPNVVYEKAAEQNVTIWY